MRPLPAPLAVASLLALAGCAGLAGPPPQQPTPTATPAPVPQSATATPAPGSHGTATGGAVLTPKPYPDLPVTLTPTAAEQFAVAYERTLGWNQRLSASTVDLRVALVASSVRADAPAEYVVRVEVAVAQTVRRDGSRLSGDGYYTAVYLVNETTVMRAAAGGRVRPGPDPRDGTVIDTHVSGY